MRLIAVTGAIAAGATTLGKALTETTGWVRFFEADVESANPFFALYHEQPLRYALHNQIAFLAQSAELHDRMRTAVATVGVQDYTPFEHTEVYAHTQSEIGRLDERELRLLERLTVFVERSFIVPDVLVYRRLSENALLDRVRGRGRPSEQKLDTEFLESVRKRFEVWVTNWRRSPVVTVDEHFDALGDPDAVAELSRRIELLLK
jgi:deoxyadenosine/deoxycytidine kinase